MSDEHGRHEPSAFEVGVVAGLRRELADAKAAAAALAQRDAATIAGLREAATAHCTWLDVLNGRIAELNQGAVEALPRSDCPPLPVLLAEAEQRELDWSLRAQEWRLRAEAGVQRIAELTAQLADYEAARDAGAAEIAMWVAEVERHATTIVELTAERDAWRQWLGDESGTPQATDRNRPAMTMEQQVRGAVARGWCHTANSHKEMDSDLAEAITQEVIKAFSPSPPSVADDTTTPGPALAAETAAILATPASEAKTPRRSDAESPPVASGEKSATGHPAGGRALPARALRGGDGIPR